MSRRKAQTPLTLNPGLWLPDDSQSNGRGGGWGRQDGTRKLQTAEITEFGKLGQRRQRARGEAVNRGPGEEGFRWAPGSGPEVCTLQLGDPRLKAVGSLQETEDEFL